MVILHGTLEHRHSTLGPAILGSRRYKAVEGQDSLTPHCSYTHKLLRQSVVLGQKMACPKGELCVAVGLKNYTVVWSFQGILLGELLLGTLQTSLMYCRMPLAKPGR